MKYSVSNKPLVCMQTTSTCYKNTRKMDVLGILWHSTGANNPNLKRYVQPSNNSTERAEMLKLLGRNLYGNDWNHIYIEVGLNAWIGKLADGTVASIQTMPWDYRPWGCASGNNGSCNNGFIQFEICEDNLKNKDYFEQVYKEGCELTAYLCEMFNIDPYGTVKVGSAKCPTILCHQDSYKLGLGSNHSDIYHWFTKYGKSMETVRDDVAKLLKQSSVKPVAPTEQPNTSPKTFKIGDVVEIIGTTYYNGKTVPSWVRKKTWVVHDVSGDRVIVNKSADGKNSIMSPFRVDTLELVSEAKSTTQTVTPESKPTETKPTTNTASNPGNKIIKGTVVSIKKGAKYYNNTAVPSWVIKKQWIVSETPSGDRVIIDKSTDGKNSICSAINSKYLTIVSGGGTVTTKTETAPSTPTIKKGSKVKVKSGAKSYTGGKLASFVYKTTYTVLENPTGDRVVIGLAGVVTAAVNKKDLIVVK